MTDRELLELAAKAAGLVITSWARSCPRIETKYGAGIVEPWNPLADDGDALRLAVQLCIGFRNMGHIMSASGSSGQFNEYADGDEYAATRRAIVRAAAEIGREMQ